MFRVIGSDIREFVSTLREETDHAVSHVKSEAQLVLDKFDLEGNKEALTEAEEEAIYRMGLREVYITPLPYPEYDLNSHTDISLMEEKVDEPEVDEIEAKELRLFLDTFNIQDKTGEIADLLERHNDTLQVQFQELVPQYVSYEDFWKRHFYRCDPVRIARAWDAQDAKIRKERKAKVAAVTNALAKPVNAISNPLKTITGVVLMKGTNHGNDLDDDNETSLLVYTRKELEDMQHAIAASNHRIASLRTKLDETKERLEETENEANALKIELEKTKAALRVKENQANKLEEQLASMNMPNKEEIDDTTLTEEQTEADHTTSPVVEESTLLPTKIVETTNNFVTKSSKTLENNNHDSTEQTSSVTEEYDEDPSMQDEPLTPISDKKSSSTTSESIDNKVGFSKKSLFALSGLWGRYSSIGNDDVDDDESVSDGWSEQDDDDEVEQPSQPVSTFV